MSESPDDIAERRTAVYDKIAMIRQFREDLVEQIRTAEVDLDDLFARADNDPVVADTKILGLVESLPDVGKVRSRRALAAAGIAESARLVDTSPTQLSMLAERLSEFAA